MIFPEFIRQVYISRKRHTTLATGFMGMVGQVILIYIRMTAYIKGSILAKHLLLNIHLQLDEIPGGSWCYFSRAYKDNAANFEGYYPQDEWGNLSTKGDEFGNWDGLPPKFDLKIIEESDVGEIDASLTQRPTLFFVDNPSLTGTYQLKGFEQSDALFLPGNQADYNLQTLSSTSFKLEYQQQNNFI